jgi:glycosyltransferase involved in cell wall biosynthesis
MFSVIIPLYNKGVCIEKCLHSVLNQSFRDFEVIIMNDGSTDDGTERVMDIIQSSSGWRAEGARLRTKSKENGGLNYENKIRLISQPNSGVSSARNNGVKAAKYDYIAFLDADDWWDEHFLEEMHELAIRYPDAALFGSNYYYVKNRNNRIENKGLPGGFVSGYIDYISLYASHFVVPVNCSFVVVKKDSFLSDGGFKPNLKFGEDFDLWIRLALKHPVAYMNKPLAFSNQDLPADNRAVGNPELYNPENHFIFNLGYLEAQESSDPVLKCLLDGLRVRSLQQYYLKGKFSAETTELLKSVDFSKQPLYYRFIYKSPKPLVKLFFSVCRIGSKIKQELLKNLRYKLVFKPFNSSTT